MGGISAGGQLSAPNFEKGEIRKKLMLVRT